MTICKDCNTPMQPIMSFSKDKREKFDRCPKCFGDSPGLPRYTPLAQLVRATVL